MGVAPWLKVYIADEMCSGRFFMSVILLVDGLHELYAGTAGGGQVNVMREPFKHISDRCRLINDSVRYETLYDAIIVAEDISASLLHNVEPENLFFIFGQTIQSLGYAPIETPCLSRSFDERNSVGDHGNGEQRNSNYKGKPKHRAVVLCKLKNSNELEKVLAGKENNGSHDTKCYDIAWSELQELKESLGGFSKHIERPNVRAKRATAAGRQARADENVLCTARPGMVA